MKKYYVQCGSQALVLHALTAQQAALRLMDEALSAHIWIYDDQQLSDRDRRDHIALEALMHLGTVLTVSERGFGGCDAGSFEVPELLDQWHRCMTSVSRLFVSAGLVPRRILPQPVKLWQNAAQVR